MSAPTDGIEQARAGLCATCVHVRRVRSDRGAVFYRCGRSDADPGYRRYPPLPVQVCQGHVGAPESD